jgi:primosomal protein N' (replication factor Y) (superfamily II helicase)
MTSDTTTGQVSHSDRVALLKRSTRPRIARPPEEPAAERPVAQVAVDLPLAHLDRPFDYLVPASMHEQAVPGCRVKVRFSGRDIDGFLLGRGDETAHVGRLSPLRRVVSPEPVLTPLVVDAARMVADRYAGTLADVLRLAVPARHGRVEREPLREVDRPRDAPIDVLHRAWESEVGGSAWVDRLARGDHPRAVWTAPAGADWAERVAASAAAARRSGRGSLLLAPDARDVARLDAALARVLGPGSHVVLTADLGPAARYRAFLAISRGRADIVVGTRAAAFAPVRRLGLVALWDDGDDLYAEQRAPYPHAREVLLIRAYHEQAAMLIGGYSRTVEAQALIESGWANELSADREMVRAAAPQVNVTGETDTDLARDPAARSARMPAQVFTTVREALLSGPVLVQSPRYGYQPALACSQCRLPARCARCSGPLGRPGGATVQCRRCGAVDDDWRCPHCRGARMRAPVVGSLRTAEEWGRSFPQTPVVTSGGDHVLDQVDDRPAIVVATPGAEPRVAGGYAGAVLLDTWLTLSLPGLRAGEEALRRWLRAAALVRPAEDGGRVVAVGDPALPVLQALVRWDPTGFAARELAERRSAGLTPTARLATMTAPADVLTEALAAISLPRGADVLGPVDAGDGMARVVLRMPAARGVALSRALQQLQASRSSRKLPPVRVQIDPTELV